MHNHKFELLRWKSNLGESDKKYIWRRSVHFHGNHHMGVCVCISPNRNYTPNQNNIDTLLFRILLTTIVNMSMTRCLYIEASNNKFLPIPLSIIVYKLIYIWKYLECPKLSEYITACACCTMKRIFFLI